MQQRFPFVANMATSWNINTIYSALYYDMSTYKFSMDGLPHFLAFALGLFLLRANLSFALFSFEVLN